MSFDDPDTTAFSDKTQFTDSAVLLTHFIHKSTFYQKPSGARFLSFVGKHFQDSQNLLLPAFETKMRAAVFGRNAEQCE